MPGEDGTTQRQHLQSAARQGDRRAQLELAGPADLPAPAAHVWTWYCELAAARPAGFGLSPIGYAEIAAWRDLTGARPGPHEVEWLRALDQAFLKAHAKKGIDAAED